MDLMKRSCGLKWKRAYFVAGDPFSEQNEADLNGGQAVGCTKSCGWNDGLGDLSARLLKTSQQEIWGRSWLALRNVVLGDDHSAGMSSFIKWSRPFSTLPQVLWSSLLKRLMLLTFLSYNLIKDFTGLNFIFFL